MAKVLTEESNLQNIAAAIRRKKADTVKYLPSEMAGAIDEIESYPEPFGEKSITQNGLHNVKDYEFADVDVSAQIEPEDEGKVVVNGELVEQTSTTVTENGTYDTTANDEVVVNVSGGSPVIQSLSVNQNGTYTPPSGVDGYAPVTVNVSGGGSDANVEFDFTKVASKTYHGVTYGTSGAVFDNANDYIQFGDIIDAMLDKTNGFTIEVDVAAMQLTSGAHRRFVMATTDKGFIYRSTGKWAFYNNSWEEGSFSGVTDGNLFDNSTVKVYVDVNNLWHIYKDGVLLFEPSLSLAVSFKDFCLGATSTSINNATITAIRFYSGFKQ